MFVLWFAFGIIHRSRLKKKRMGEALEHLCDSVHCLVAVPKPTGTRNLKPTHAVKTGHSSDTTL